MRLPRASGILLHPSSLAGPHGSGDLGAAAHHFIDWLAAAGQMLPLGGIGAGHSPYMSVSAFAGNVLLIDLADLAAQGWLSDEELIAPRAAMAAGGGASRGRNSSRGTRSGWKRWRGCTGETQRPVVEVLSETHRFGLVRTGAV